MAILSVTEEFGGRTGGINGTYERDYTRVFEVVTSSPYVGPLAVRLDSRVPQVGAHYTNGVDPADPLHEFDNGAFVGKVQCDEVGGPEGAGIAWKVTVQYQPWDAAAFGPDPLLWKVRVQFGGERTERVVDFDTRGVPIRNSAGDRFGDPVTVDDHITTLVITRNERVSAFDVRLASLYSDTINLFDWNGIPAGFAKMGIISTGEEEYDSNNQVWYYKVTYPVQLNRKRWRKELLDQGFNELVADAYGALKTRPIMNDGQPIADPVALDGSGHRLDPEAAYAYGGPVTLAFDVFDELDWTGLNINLSLRLGL